MQNKNMIGNRKMFITLFAITIVFIIANSIDMLYIHVLHESSIFEQVKMLTQCSNRPLEQKMQQRGEYWVLYNYVRAERRFKCEESITYTTHADYSFLDNLFPILERWQGPISVALYAPGSDFETTMQSIAYMRECTESLVKEYVTFHVYFGTKHVPSKVPHHSKALSAFDCSMSPPFLNVNVSQMYRTKKKLLYPVNVGRNVARETAQTHFILPSDIELYPSPNLIPQFLAMIARNLGPLRSKNPKVFPLTLYEVKAEVQVPLTKSELKKMLASGKAQTFHKTLCPTCHNVPKSAEWIAANETDKLDIFHVGKRNEIFLHWEPIFIGTHSDPLYDERLSWEGRSDKMPQGYAFCVLNYDFDILNNAFLVHRPGIKPYKRDKKRSRFAAEIKQFISKIILPELKVLYGVRNGCAV